MPSNPSTPAINERSIILASTSRYRADLLRRLALPFDVATPDCDETPLPAETASVLVRRLSEGKAQSLATHYPDSLIIGSDQVCDLNGQIIGKPGSTEAAIEQLQAMSGNAAVFRTGLCLLDTASGEALIDEIEVFVRFRNLHLQEIERYVSVDKPLDCAGSFRSEGLGISLLISLDGPDPSALVGLPLIRLSEMLRSAAVPVP